MGWSSDRWPIYRAALGEAGRALLGAVIRVPHALGRRPVTPGRLILAPQELRTSDATAAEDIAAGFFAFAGRVVQTDAPFAAVPPSPSWAEAFYGFAWLRHLRAAGATAVSDGGRALVAEAIGPRRRELRRGPAARPEVAARRLISLLGHAPVLLEGASAEFYLAYLQVVGEAADRLGWQMRRARRPRARLSAAVAVCFAGLCTEGLEGPLWYGTRALERELRDQIGPEGIPASRDPAELIEILLDLLPLRHLYESRSFVVPEELDSAIDRMTGALRFLRHADGELALFNGMGLTPVDALATILAHDTGRAAPAGSAGGYHRLEAGGSVVLADLGAAPPLDASAAAHAGCLSFELSVDGERIVVNCGAAPLPGPRRDGARQTAAHSTATVGHEASALLLAGSDQPGEAWADRLLRRRLGPVLLRGPAEVEVHDVVRDGATQTIAARHDGYLASFGLLHERRLRLASGGAILDGVDRIRPQESGHRAARRPGPVSLSLRFHLAPGLTARLEDEARTILIGLPSGRLWRFGCTGAAASVAEGVSFAVPEGRRAALQIVVETALPADQEGAGVAWRFERLEAAPAAVGS